MMTTLKKIVLDIMLVGGICSPVLYMLTDIAGAQHYSGYSFKDQAVSELFAIGAPTANVVVIFFTISSLLMLLFSVGVWLSSNDSRILRVLSIVILANAIDSLILWNFFPMHMRGIQPTFTDTMHGILAINPFVLISIILGAVHFRNWFRLYSIITILLLLATATTAFSYVPLVISNKPTPWMGLTERMGQYVHQVWHAALAIVLLRANAVKKLSS